MTYIIYGCFPILGYMGGNTPTQGSSRNTPMSGQNTPRRTPRGQFDTTPLYDE